MLRDRRCIILSAMPTEATELKTIFSENPEGIRRKLECPPRLRASGWDLPNLTQAEFVRGELIRVVERGRMIVDLYRDGTFVLAGQIHRNFLAWSDKSDSHFHPLALIELTVNFTRFYGLVLKDLEVPPDSVELRVELRNMHLANENTLLGSGAVGTFHPFGVGSKQAPEDNWSQEFAVAAKSYDPDRVAFLLIRELYLWFGHSEEAIPYTRDTGNGRVIDADQIASIR